MAPEATACGVFALGHLHGAQATSGPQCETIGLRECDHVMIAAVHAVQERNHAARLVGKAEAQNPHVELNRPYDVANVHDYMCEAGMRVVGAVLRVFAPRSFAPRDIASKRDLALGDVFAATRISIGRPL